MLSVQQHVRRLSPWIERLARVGYVAIGVVYMIVGGLTAAAALHHGGKPADKQDALAFILGQPFGSVLLLIAAAGIVGYAVWSISSGIFDAQNRGREAKGLALRAGNIIGGCFYLAVAAGVARLALYRTGGGSSDMTAKELSARAMAHPFGRWLVAAAGVGVMIAGGYQLYRVWKGKLSRQLDLRGLALRWHDTIVATCLFGFAARGVVFLVIGGSLVIAAIRHTSRAARGTAGAFRAIGERPFGTAVLALVAVGFIAYGCYALLNARYRRIDAA